MTKFSDDQKAAFKPVLDAITAMPASPDVPGTLVVRPGYRYSGAAGTTKAVPAVVFAVAPARLDDARKKVPALEASFGVPVEVQEASLDEQLAVYDKTRRALAIPATPLRGTPFEKALRGIAPVDFAPPKRPDYEPPPVALKRVKAKMKVTVSASPEEGWPLLRGFLETVKDTLTIGMYQFTAPHIADAVVATAGRITGDVLLTLHPVPEAPAKSGVKKDDRPEADVMTALQGAAGGRFGYEWAPIFAGGVFSSAYHIKVAVADAATVWLSSGNWQSSNQPDVSKPKPPRFQHNYNRDYHAVLESPELAEIFGKYLEYDFATAKKIAHKPPASWEGPDVVVPDDYTPPDFPLAPQFFPPLSIDRVVDVQPLLTPDNYAVETKKLIDSATKSIAFQNQYINLRADENFPEFDALVDALLAKQQAGVAVRIICRDMMGSDKLDLLVAKGFDPDSIRFQPACHNKCIIIDGEAIAFGSHNWSNDGAVTNRDATLIFRDAEIAAHFLQIYDYDWKRLATAQPTRPKKSARVAEGDEDGNPESAVER